MRKNIGILYFFQMTEPQHDNMSQDTERLAADRSEKTLDRQVSNGGKQLSENIDSEPGERVIDSKPKLNTMPIDSESMPQQNSSEAEIVSKKTDESNKNADIENIVDKSLKKSKESGLASQENVIEIESGHQASTTSVAQPSQEVLREGEIDSKEVRKNVEIMAEGKIKIDDNVFSPAVGKEDNSISLEDVKGSNVASQEMVKDFKSVSQTQSKDDDLNSQKMAKDDKAVSQEQVKTAEFDSQEMAKEDKSVSKEQFKDGGSKTEGTEIMNIVAAFISEEMARDNEIAFKQSKLENKEMTEDDKTGKVSEIDLKKMDEEQKAASGENLPHEELTKDDNVEREVKEYVEEIIKTATVSFAAGASSEDASKAKRIKKKEKSQTALPPLVLYRPAKFEAHSTQKTYLSYPPLAQLPFYPKLAFPRKWGVPLTFAEPRTVLVGFTCPPAPKFRQDQLMTHAASTLRRYYSKPCIKTVEWIKVPGKN